MGRNRRDRRTPPGVRELKHIPSFLRSEEEGRTPPGVRELKLRAVVIDTIKAGRTPPGVRELKRMEATSALLLGRSRTPPGVRELKHDDEQRDVRQPVVAPLPGCVN